MVADDVEVAVVDERVVASIQAELDVVHSGGHEHIEHGAVDAAALEREVDGADMKCLPGAIWSEVF